MDFGLFGRPACLIGKKKARNLANQFQGSSYASRSRRSRIFSSISRIARENHIRRIKHIVPEVGNLVCPAEFDTGAVKNMTILSVPEGHEKPLKYPLMYETCQLLVINKIDVMPYFDFDVEKVIAYAKMRNPHIEILFVSAKTGEGVE